MAVLTPYLDKLKSHLSIDAVVGEKVRLESKGNRMWGLCPFHAENTPSFTVSVDRGSYKCCGCGEFGDIISFVRETEGLEFSRRCVFLPIKLAWICHSNSHSKILKNRH